MILSSKFDINNATSEIFHCKNRKNRNNFLKDDN